MEKWDGRAGWRERRGKKDRRQYGGAAALPRVHKATSIPVIQLTLPLKLVTLEDSFVCRILLSFCACVCVCVCACVHCSCSLLPFFFLLITASPSSFCSLKSTYISTINSYLATGYIISKSGEEKGLRQQRGLLFTVVLYTYHNAFEACVSVDVRLKKRPESFNLTLLPHLVWWQKADACVWHMLITLTPHTASKLFLEIWFGWTLWSFSVNVCVCVQWALCGGTSASDFTRQLDSTAALVIYTVEGACM